MRFMAIEPWFHNNIYYEASPEKPHVFDFPDNEIPNVRWYPLEEKALLALEALQAQILTYGNRVIIHKIPSGLVGLPSTQKIDPKPQTVEDNFPPGFALRQNGGVPQSTMSEIQAQSKSVIPKGQRPSDMEPPTPRR